MITGLRFNCSSVQDQFNLKPSISTFGKCFGGGFANWNNCLKKDILKKMSKNKKKRYFLVERFLAIQLVCIFPTKWLLIYIKIKNLFSKI